MLTRKILVAFYSYKKVEDKRDDVIAAIHGCGRDDIGKQLWKMCLGYHERSVVETAMFRIKRMFGS